MTSLRCQAGPPGRRRRPPVAADQNSLGARTLLLFQNADALIREDGKLTNAANDPGIPGQQVDHRSLKQSLLSASGLRTELNGLCEANGCPGKLRRVDGSVLWLLESSALATANLRDEAAKSGVPRTVWFLQNGCLWPSIWLEPRGGSVSRPCAHNSQ